MSALEIHRLRNPQGDYVSFQKQDERVIITIKNEGEEPARKSLPVHNARNIWRDLREKGFRKLT
jgi:hypothetical protein